jgi:hypothetical protein
MTNCTYHCGACHMHFHSLRSFDAHRTGRHCTHPHDHPDGKFALLTETGICRMYAETAYDVSIWTLRADLDRARGLHRDKTRIAS